MSDGRGDRQTSIAEALLLAPGSGSSADHPSLLAIEAAVAPLPVRRFDFPYRLAGKRFPDKAPVLLESVAVEAATLVASARCEPSRLALGGRSMGGRMCSMAVAAGLPAAALVLICYPLHPPGKPDKLRVDHFPSITQPCLFVSGTRDPFGTVDELEAATTTIAGPVRHVWIDGAGHGLDRKGDHVLVVEAVRQFLAAEGYD